jgi:hypothetical protein
MLTRYFQVVKALPADPLVVSTVHRQSSQDSGAQDDEYDDEARWDRADVIVID